MTQHPARALLLEYSEILFSAGYLEFSPPRLEAERIDTMATSSCSIGNSLRRRVSRLNIAIAISNKVMSRWFERISSAVMILKPEIHLALCGTASYAD